MAISVVNDWVGSGSGISSQEFLIAPTPGNWLVCMIGCVGQVDPTPPAFCVGDSARNMWTLVFSSTSAASAGNSAASLYTQIWVCPNVSYTGWSSLPVYVSFLSQSAFDTATPVTEIIEVAGMGNGFLAVDSVVTNIGAAATSFSLTLPTPGADCLMVATAATNANVIPTTTSWHATTGTTSTSPNVGARTTWIEAATSQTATFTSAAAHSWVGTAVAVRQTGTVVTQPNPNVPVLDFQLGLGYTIQTPLAAVRWTSLPNRLYAESQTWVSTARGIQYEQGLVQSQPSTLTVRNDDGAFTPRTPGSATASASGTSTTVVVPTSSATNINVSDFFQITRALNPDTSFQSGTTANWIASGGTLTVVGSPTYNSAPFAGKLVPDGVSSASYIISAASWPVTPIATYTASAVVQCAVSRTVTLTVDWFDQTNTFLSSSSTSASVTGGTWTSISFQTTPPAGAAFASPSPFMGTTPPATNILYMDQVRLTPTSPDLPIYQVTGLSAGGGSTTVTFTRADGTGSGAPAATQTGDSYTGIPIDVYNPYRVVATHSGKQYPLTAGWIERWPQTWNSPHWGYINAVGIDALATLTADDQTPVRGEILARKPHSYWPLSDQSASTVAQNASYVGTATLTQTTTSHGTGTNGQAVFGAATQNVSTGTGYQYNGTSIIGDAGTGWNQSGQTGAELNTGDGFALVGDDAAFPAISSGVTITGVFFMTESQWTTLTSVTTTGQTLFVIRQTASTNTVFKLALQTAGGGGSVGYPQTTWWDQGTGASNLTNLATGAWSIFFVAWAVTLTQTSWSLYANASVGSTSTTLLGSGTCNIKPTFGHICIGGEADATANGLCLPGLYTHMAIFPRVLSKNELDTIANAVSIGNFQSPVGSNDDINRKLWYVGWRGARALQYTNIYAGSDVPASTIAEKVTALSDQEGGRLLCDASGQLQTRTRYRASYQSIKATLGDRPDLGEIPFVADDSNLVIDYDPTYVYNRVSVVNSGTSQEWSPTTATTFSTQNTTSISKYGLRTLGKNVALANGSDASSLASYLLTQYQTPQLRIQSVLIDAAAYPSALPFALSVEVGDLLTVNRRPIGAPALSFNVIVLQVQHDTGKDYWNTTLTLGAAPR